jgi:hypothetical protein
VTWDHPAQGKLDAKHNGVTEYIVTHDQSAPGSAPLTLLGTPPTATVTFLDETSGGAVQVQSITSQGRTCTTPWVQSAKGDILTETFTLGGFEKELSLTPDREDAEQVQGFCQAHAVGTEDCTYILCTMEIRRMLIAAGEPNGGIPLPLLGQCICSKETHKGPEERRKCVFSKTYSMNLWADGESRSGAGSRMDSTKAIRPFLGNVLDQLNVNSFLDCPCGDVNWQTHIPGIQAVQYTGADIVEALISANTKWVRQHVH